MLFFVVVKGLCSCVTSFEFGVFSGASFDLKYKVRLNQKHEVINIAEHLFLLLPVLRFMCFKC